MTTVNRTIENDQQKTMAIRLLEARPVPFTLSLTDGKHRSTAQNRLQHMWMAEIAQQKGDMTPAEVRAYCKLTIGVPLLRAENEAFRAKYDEVVKPLSYQQKIAIMSEPLDMPVTRIMTTKQQTQYLDAIAKHFGEQGIILTMPEDLRRELETNPNPGPEQSSPAAGEDEAGYATTPSSSEPDPAIPPPDPGSNDGSAETNASQRQAEPSSPIPEKEIIVLRRFAKDVLNMAAKPETSGELMSKVIRRWSNMELVGLSPEGKEAAKSIHASVKAIMENSTSVESEIEFYSEVLGCTPEELGGAG